MGKTEEALAKTNEIFGIEWNFLSQDDPDTYHYCLGWFYGYFGAETPNPAVTDEFFHMGFMDCRGMLE